VQTEKRRQLWSMAELSLCQQGRIARVALTGKVSNLNSR
jgi:hypothetical protein